MYTFFAKILTVLLPYGDGDTLSSIECESGSLKTAFDTNVHIEASVSYPLVPETSLLTRYANEIVQKEAYELYDTFMQEISALQEEPSEQDADELRFRYDLSLVRSTPILMSFYGSKYEYRGGVHGSWQYVTKTFLRQDNTIRELFLEDLFLPGSRERLFRYCEDYFKLNQYDDYTWGGFNSEHLDAFLLTEKGLLLIFQDHILSGYEDYPTTLLIPYLKLVSIVNPSNSLPVDFVGP